MKLGTSSLPHWPEADSRTILSVAASLRTGRWAIASPVRSSSSAIDAVEEALAHRFGRRHAVTTCNGSAAIVIALRALGIGPGCRVLVPALTWVACASAVLRTGATPVFADCEPDSLLMDLAAARASAGAIDAVLAVHLYASCLSLNLVQESFPDVPVIEDFSHVHGGRAASGTPLGSGVEISICSFQASKLLTCGEGGAAFTDDPALALRLAALRADSRVRDRSARSDALTDLAAFPEVQGANYALSEPNAALLADQLGRLDEQLARRAEGARRFADAAGDRGLALLADPALLDCGAFYRLPVVVPEASSAAKLAAQARQWVAESTGFVIDEAYLPIPNSALYQPQATSQFAHAGAAADELPRARRWATRILPLQHELFLASAPLLEAVVSELAAALLGSARPRAAPVPPSAEAVTVVIVTRRDRDGLATALNSVAAQDYGGEVHVLVVEDEGPVARPLEPGLLLRDRFRHLRIQLDSGWSTLAPVARIATLRNVALGLVETPLIAFLDDDNIWAPDHLSSLQACMAGHAAMAAYCWRRLTTPNGARWDGQDFPWLPAGDERGRMWSKMLEQDIMRVGDNVVRDRARLSEGSRGMVDLGAWLFRTDLLRLMPFSSRYDADELAQMVGEDDKLLANLVAAGIDLPCTGKPTLCYRLGGMSNGPLACEASA